MLNMIAKDSAAELPRTPGGLRAAVTSGLRYATANRGNGNSYWPVGAAIVIIWGYFEIASGGFFLDARNLGNLFTQMAAIGCVAVGVVFVLLIAEIDLSVGSLVGLSAAVLGVLITRLGAPWWLAILAGLVTAAAVGLAQGIVFATLRVPAFVITLAGLLGWLGVQLQVLGTEGTTNVLDPVILGIAGSHIPKAFGWVLLALVIIWQAATKFHLRSRRARAGLLREPLGLIVARLALVAIGLGVVVTVLNRWLGIPSAGLVLVLLVVASSWLVRRTVFGRHMLAVGGSVRAARRAGINVTRVRALVLMLSGLTAGIGGVIAVSRGGAATTLTGGGTLLLEAIAAAVIGGTSLFGGRGTVWSALTGALIMASLENGLDLTGQSANVKYIVEMIVLVFAVGLDALIRRRTGPQTDSN